MASYNFRRKKGKKTATQTPQHVHAVTATNMAEGEEETSLNKLLDAIQETKEDLTKHINKKTADIQNNINENRILNLYAVGADRGDGDACECKRRQYQRYTRPC